MSNQVDSILKNIEGKKFNTYTEFTLNKPINMNSDEMQKILYMLNNKTNITATYNKNTCICDMIGVYDDNDNNRWIDFDDNMWTMENKGVTCYTTQTRFN